MSNHSPITKFSNMLLGSPIVWGGLGCLGFYALLGKSTLKNEMFARYFEGHPVEYITTALFFIGAAALIMKLIGLMLQKASLNQPMLEEVPPGGQPVEDAAHLLAQLDGVPASMQSSYLVRRLRAAVEYVRRKGTAESLDSHLHHLADEDFGHMIGSYAFIRIVIWAIPILGFLGTVIGITLAIAKLSPQALEKSLTAVTGGLGVAFDTTALALSLSIILMFAKYFVEQMESKLLTKVDSRVQRELVGRFQVDGAANDPQVALIRRASDAIVESTENLVQKQADVWKESMEAANERWTSLTSAAGEVVEKALAEAVSESIEKHASVLEGGLKEHSTEILSSISLHSAIVGEATDKHTSAITQSTDQLADALTESIQQYTASHRGYLQETSAALTELLSKSQSSLECSVTEYRETLATGTEQVAGTLQQSLAEHREAILNGEATLAEENRRHLSEVQFAIVEAAAATIEQQEQLVKQGDVLLKVVDATGQVQRLEESLNSNLSALAGSHNFEETVTSLAAAIQLLSVQLGQPKSKFTSISLGPDEQQTPAAA